MGIFNIIDPILDFIFVPLLSLGYFVFLLVISFLISLMLMLMTKYLTDQKLMKELRDNMKSYQEQMKQHKSNPSKVMELQKKSMEQNLIYMKHSFKTTIYSFLPIIIIIGWMSSHASYLPISPNEQFSANLTFSKNFNDKITIEVPNGMEVLSERTVAVKDGKASWNLKASKEGSYNLVFNTESSGILEKRILITTKPKYEPVVKIKKGLIDFIYGSREGYINKESPAINIQLSNKPVKPLVNISIFGWRPGWLGTYIILSIIFTMVLRKIMKVH